MINIKAIGLVVSPICMYHYSSQIYINTQIYHQNLIDCWELRDIIGGGGRGGELFDLLFLEINGTFS